MSLIAGGPFNVLNRVLTVAEILALDTVPVELLPAKTGVLYMPFYISFHKGAGTGYTAADIALENASGVQYVIAEGAAFLAQTAEATLAEKVGGGQITEVGNNLQLRLLSATATGDQPVRVKLLYFEDYPGLAS